MAQFIFDIPDAEAARIAAAVCASQGYGPAGMADATEFTKAYVFRHLARIVIEQDAADAAAQAADAVRANPDDPLAQWLYPPTPPAPEPPIPGPVGPTGPDGPTGPVGGETGATAFGVRR